MESLKLCLQADKGEEILFLKGIRLHEVYNLQNNRVLEVRTDQCLSGISSALAKAEKKLWF